MNIRHFLSAAIIPLIVVMTTPPAAAQAGEWFVGGSLGSSDDDMLDQTASSFKAFGGYQFAKNLGVEIALVDLGEFDSLGLPNSLEQWGLAYGIVGILPIGDRGAVFGKVGFFDWTVDFLSRTVDEGTDPTFGVGGEYTSDNNWGVRVELERFTDVSGGDVDLFSVGVVYRFR
ncbi:MAG: outer membrane beta-barrel protein [Acidiferrobacterales bacterium]